MGCCPLLCYFFGFVPVRKALYKIAGNFKIQKFIPQIARAIFDPTNINMSTTTEGETQPTTTTTTTTSTTSTIPQEESAPTPTPIDNKNTNNNTTEQDNEDDDDDEDETPTITNDKEATEKFDEAYELYKQDKFQQAANSFADVLNYKYVPTYSLETH